MKNVKLKKKYCSWKSADNGGLCADIFRSHSFFYYLYAHRVSFVYQEEAKKHYHHRMIIFNFAN